MPPKSVSVTDGTARTCRSEYQKEDGGARFPRNVAADSTAISAAPGVCLRKEDYLRFWRKNLSEVNEENLSKLASPRRTEGSTYQSVSLPRRKVNRASLSRCRDSTYRARRPTHFEAAHLPRARARHAEFDEPVHRRVNFPAAGFDRLEYMCRANRVSPRAGEGSEIES